MNHVFSKASCEALGSLFLSFLLITKSLHVPQEVGSPACGRKGMQTLKDQLLMFGTLHILCGRPHVLCCPRDLYSNLSYSIHVLCGFRQVAWYLWAFFFFLWNEHNSYLTGLLWENNWKLSSDTNMGLTDSFLSLLGYSDCVSLKWHFWRMTIKVKLAEKDEIMVEVQGFNGADLERKEQRRYCSCHWVLHAFLVFVVALPEGLF